MMKLQCARALAAGALSASISGCGGGGSGSGSLPVAPPPKVPNTTYAKFVVKIPGKGLGTASRRSKWITSNVQGISFSVSDATNTSLGGYAFYPLTPTSPGCSGSPPSGVTCNLDVVAPPGNDTFYVNLYDTATEPGLGYIISTGTVTAAITAQASNTVTIATNGVPTWAVMGFANQFPVSAGTYPLSIKVTDPSGDEIVGPYDVPMTLTDSDTSGATTLSKTTLAQQSDTIGVTLNWNGLALPSGAIVTMNTTDSIVLNESGSGVIANALISPGVIGPALSQGIFYFKNSSDTPQTPSIIVQGSTPPFFFTSTTCSTAYISVSGASPSFTVTPIAPTTPLSGGSPQASTFPGLCQIGLTDSASHTATYWALVGQ